MRPIFYTQHAIFFFRRIDCSQGCHFRNFGLPRWTYELKSRVNTSNIIKETFTSKLSRIFTIPASIAKWGGKFMSLSNWTIWSVSTQVCSCDECLQIIVLSCKRELLQISDQWRKLQNTYCYIDRSENNKFLQNEKKIQFEIGLIFAPLCRYPDMKNTVLLICFQLLLTR